MNDIIGIISHMGIFAQVILAILFFLSMMCWAVIIEKAMHLRHIKNESKTFLGFFKDHRRLTDLYKVTRSFQYSPFPRIFGRIFNELAICIESQRPDKALFHPMIQNEVALIRKKDIKNILEVALAEEITPIEKHMILLATSVTVCPFLGLLGTVWGVMTAFMAMGASNNADISAVGPGMAEALITTIAGLAVAIPCLFAYNIFADRIHKLEGELDIFCSKIVDRVDKEITV